MSTIAPTAAQVPPPHGPLERFLRLFADVRADEAAQLLLLTLNVFLILTAYYVMKPVREALILDQPGGAELKSYAYAAQAGVLFVLVPLYGALATRLPRRRLINVVTAFFIACLPVFYLLAEAKLAIGLAVLPLDRGVQPDADRPVLGVRERRLHARCGEAAVRHHRLWRLHRGGVRIVGLEPPDPHAGGAPAAARRGRRTRCEPGAVQFHRFARGGRPSRAASRAARGCPDRRRQRVRTGPAGIAISCSSRCSSSCSTG